MILWALQWRPGCSTWNFSSCPEFKQLTVLCDLWELVQIIAPISLLTNIKYFHLSIQQQIQWFSGLFLQLLSEHLPLSWYSPHKFQPSEVFLNTHCLFNFSSTSQLCLEFISQSANCQKKVEVIVCLTLIFLHPYDPVLPVIQCPQIIASYILTSFVVYDGKVFWAPVIPS